MKYYLGIDGGGSVTRVAVGGTTGAPLYTDVFPSINGYGSSKSCENLKIIVDELMRRGFEKFEAAYIGSSEFISQPQEKSKDLFEQYIPAKMLQIRGDADILLRNCQRRPAALIIAGTGSVLGYVGRGEVTMYKGGRGHLVGDQGSGYTIGRSGIEAALKSMDGWGKETSLVSMLIKYFGTNDTEEITDKIYCGDKHIIALFAPYVERTALRGDSIAEKIISDNAESLYLQFKSLIDKTEIPIEVILHGSMLVKSLYYRKKLIDKLNNDREYDIYVSETPAEILALELARKL